jgi:parallel beta-helix repeat protein
VPEGLTLEIEPGASLEMESGVSLVCFGPLRAAGTAAAPIRVVPAGGKPWGTLAVVRPDAESVFRHVELAGGSGAAVDGIVFTGALAVHGGDVSIEACRIRDCPAEDAVNVKRGRVRVADTLFTDNASDSIDLDFTEGAIERCQFVNTGGDAVDTSGSRITIAGSRIEGAGDKGISVGEESEVEVSDNLLIGNAIGIAVKDRSTARISQCTLTGNGTAVAAYRKKPIFGGGHAEVRACVVLDSDAPFTVDEFSTVDMTGCILPSGYSVPGCTTAGVDLLDRLRRNGFVLYTDAASAGRHADTGTADRDAAGIIGPPVELR